MNVAADITTPLRILILALGGEGGGVLMNWVVAAARAAGCEVQATSVPGVAQRTGSTTYYLEVSPAGTKPVLNLVPLPARVDIVIASELVEAARAMEGGYVSPDRTTLIASTNRVISTAEKIQMADGRFAGENIENAARELAKTCHLANLSALAEDNGTFISATLFGALNGAGVLPWDAEVSKSVMGSGATAEASKRGFDAAIGSVRTPAEKPAPSAPEQPKSPAEVAGFPEPIREVVALGLDRTRDFQDAAYGQLYLDRVHRLIQAAGKDNPATLHALNEAARRLALWMAYEDVARVAQLKTRPERFTRIRQEAQMKPGQILRVTEYLKPRLEEVADVMPLGIGRRLMKRADAGKGLPFLGKGLHIRSNGVFGYWALRKMTLFRLIRRKSLRYHNEQAAIEDWLQALEAAVKSAPAFAEALAELPRVRKGYSDTLVRGCLAYRKIWDGLVRPALDTGDTAGAAPKLRQAIAAAMADEKHTALDALLAGQAMPLPMPKLK